MPMSTAQILAVTAGLITLLVCAAHCAPNSNRFLYSMGLGKRVYSPYSFGLGKRSGSDDLYLPIRDARGRHVFSFGLGKREMEGEFEPLMLAEEDGEDDSLMEAEKRGSGQRVYGFGLGKRADSGKSFYSFGLGKRNVVVEEGHSPLVTVKEIKTDVKEKGRNFRQDLRRLMTGKIFVHLSRIFLAELLGTYIYLVFALGCVAQIVYSDASNYTETSAMFVMFVGEGMALSLGMYAAGRITGGHLNPIISLALAVRGNLSWTVMAVEWLAQYLGAYLAAFSVYFLYHDALQRFTLPDQEAGNYVASASIFASHSQNYTDVFDTDESNGYRWGASIVNVIFNSTVFTLLYLGLTDKRKSTAEEGHVPVLSGLLITVLGLSVGFNCGTAINPARDFGSRLFIWNAGWPFSLLTSITLRYSLIPSVLPYLGALFGLGLYELLIGNHLPRIPTKTTALNNMDDYEDSSDVYEDLLVKRSEVIREETDRTRRVKIIG